MNKGRRINLIVAIIFTIICVIGVIIYDISNPNLGANIMMRNILIGLAVLFCLFFIFGWLYGLTLRKKNKKYVTLLKESKYDESLIIVLKLVELAPTTFYEQQMDLQAALLYLIKNDELNFIKYIEKVNHIKLKAVRYYWTALVNFINDNIGLAKAQYQLFLESPKELYKVYKPYEFYKQCLSGLLDYYERNNETAKEKLEKIYPEIRNPVAVSYYGKVLKALGSSVPPAE